MRREHEADDFVGAGGETRCVDRIGDARRPVLHPGVDRQPELRLERGARLLGDRVERRRVLDPEPPVALDEIGEVLGRDRPAAANVGVVRGNVGEPLGRAVRHEDDGGASRRRTVVADERREAREDVGIGLRQDAVAEVEDVTRARRRARGRRAPPPRRAPTARAAAPARGSPAPRDRRRSASATSSGMRQSTPIASPPARAISREQLLRRAGAEVDRRDARRRRAPARSTARRTPRSRPARARRPTSRRAGSRQRLPRRPPRRTARTDPRAAP